MGIASLALAVSSLQGSQNNLYSFFSFSVLAFASILVILKPRYVQYCYYVLVLTWFFVIVGGFALKSVLLIQVNPYSYRLLPTVICTFLPMVLLSVFVALYLSVAARVWFHKPIKNKHAIFFLNITIALAIASLSWIVYFFSAGLRPSVHWIVELHYSSYMSFLLILGQFTFVYFLFSALPLAILSSFVKSWSKWQAVSASLFASIVLLFTTDRMLSFLVLESKRGNLYISQFFVSIALLLSSYYLSKYIQKRFIRNKFLIGFD